MTVAPSHLCIPRSQAKHNKEHGGERAYADDIWTKSEDLPDQITAMNMDAPTQEQFDIPIQDRKVPPHALACHADAHTPLTTLHCAQARDPVKCLATAKKWGSQMMGVMVAGLGMHCYVVRSGIGAGPNLTCTCLYLSILALSKTPRGLGRCIARCYLFDWLLTVPASSLPCPVHHTLCTCCTE